MTYVVMDNWVYGLTKNQTSPTSPLGFKSKTDLWGAVDHPINPMKQAIAAGATFVARTTHTNPNHVLQMMEAAMDHDGFSFIECLSECVEFYEGAFDASNPRKGGVFKEVPKDHDVTNEDAAYKLAGDPFPGYFGVFYKNAPSRRRTPRKPRSSRVTGQGHRPERLADPPKDLRPDEIVYRTPNPAPATRRGFFVGRGALLCGARASARFNVRITADAQPNGLNWWSSVEAG